MSVQRLELQAFTAEGKSSIPHLRYYKWHSKAKKQKQLTGKYTISVIWSKFKNQIDVRDE